MKGEILINPSYSNQILLQLGAEVKLHETILISSNKNQFIKIDFPSVNIDYISSKITYFEKSNEGSAIAEIAIGYSRYRLIRTYDFTIEELYFIVQSSCNLLMEYLNQSAPPRILETRQIPECLPLKSILQQMEDLVRDINQKYTE